MYKASADFNGAFHHVAPSDPTISSQWCEKRHILDKQLIALILNIADVSLSPGEFDALKQVINDGRIINLYKYTNMN